jgi:hypothetical protein
MDHLGVEVETTAEVSEATQRLADLGLFPQVENDRTCCHALQDKVWVHGPGNEPSEVYTVKADAPDATKHPPRRHHPRQRRLPMPHPTRNDDTGRSASAEEAACCTDPTRPDRTARR